MNKDDQVIGHIEDTGEINEFGDNVTDVIEEYHGTNFFTCYHSMDNIYMTENILEEQMNGSWSVLICINCLNPNNRPCVFCCERCDRICNQNCE